MKRLDSKGKITMRLIVLLAASALTLVLAVPLCLAGIKWAPGGVPIANTPNVDEERQQMTTDGSGGAIIAWEREESGSADEDIYAARVDSGGTILWGPVPIGATPNIDEDDPEITYDGSGGAIITWEQEEAGSPTDNDIYAARVDSGGTILWGPSPIGAAPTLNEDDAEITSDGSAGAVLTWRLEKVTAPGLYNIYAARVNSGGALLWGPNAIDAVPNIDGFDPEITTDGAAGAVIAWEREESVGAGLYDIYASRVNSGGAALWGPTALSAVPNIDETRPEITSDGAAGAIIAWQREESVGAGIDDIYASRVNSAGAVLWGPNAIGVVPNIDEWDAEIATAEAVITWMREESPGSTLYDIYASKLSSGGAVQWGPTAVSAVPNVDEYDTQIASDGEGGAVITWQQQEFPGSGDYDIYASKLNAWGAVPWGPTAIGAVSNIDETYPEIVADGSGGGIITWEREESAGSGDDDIYAQRVTDNAFYFAEGYTGSGFQEYLCLGNATNAPIEVNVTYLFSGEPSIDRTYNIGPYSRFTANVNAEVGPDKQVSIKCQSDNPFIAERPMYFNYQGAWSGGHDAVGATRTSDTWYFAEGYTGTGFDEWICVLNPGDNQADLTFYFQTQEEGEKVVPGFSVAPHSRASFKANDLLQGGSYQTSLKLESTQPVVAERPMYFSYQGTAGWNWTGGHCVLGTPDLGTSFYFAEGTTRESFEEWLTLQNPGATDISVHAVYQLGQGAPIEKDYPVPAAKRSTIYVPNEVGIDQDVSVHLSSTSQFLAERPMYYNYQGTAAWNWPGGHCVIGATSQGTDWFFAEGYTGSGFEEWLCIQNPGTTEANIAITYYPEGGTPIAKPSFNVAPNSRYTVLVNLDAGADLAICAEVASNQPIICERPMYFNYNGVWPGGHDVVGYVP